MFGGDSDGNFMAIDARAGKPLWRFQTGGSVRGSPISYRFRGKQYITVAAGSALLTFALPD